MDEPTWWQFKRAWLRYEKDRLRSLVRYHTGRCPACPKRPGGPHKFGCHRPGPLPSLRSVREH
jgi:hypothetical protein